MRGWGGGGRQRDQYTPVVWENYNNQTVVGPLQVDLPDKKVRICFSRRCCETIDRFPSAALVVTKSFRPLHGIKTSRPKRFIGQRLFIRFFDQPLYYSEADTLKSTEPVGGGGRGGYLPRVAGSLIVWLAG